MEIYRILGIILIFAPIVGTLAWVLSKGTHKVFLVSFTGVCGFFGLVLVLSDRISEITITGVGTVKTAAERATASADAIARLRERLESQGATVEAIAGEARKATELSNLAAKQTTEAEQKLKRLDEAIDDASNLLVKIKMESDFISTVVAAQNDDRVAYDRLRKIEKDTADWNNIRAGRAADVIFEQHNSPMYNSGLVIPWLPGINPAELSLQKLKLDYNSAPPILRPAFIEYIWSRNDISKLQRLDFMTEIMRTDSSLTAVEYAGRYFTAGTGLKLKPLATEYLLNWWSEHRPEFVEKVGENPSTTSKP